MDRGIYTVQSCGSPHKRIVDLSVQISSYMNMLYIYTCKKYLTSQMIISSCKDYSVHGTVVWSFFNQEQEDLKGRKKGEAVCKKKLYEIVKILKY